IQDGLALLEQNAKGGVLSVADEHAKASIYAKRSYYWRQAIELYEKLQTQLGGLKLDEQLALAGLYEHYTPDKARRLYHEVLTANPDNAVIIHYCARNLLRHGDQEGMANALARLEKLEGPQSLHVLEIRVRLFKAQGKLEEGEKVLREYAERPDAQLETAAALLEEFGRTGAAQSVYKK